MGGCCESEKEAHEQHMKDTKRNVRGGVGAEPYTLDDSKMRDL